MSETTRDAAAEAAEPQAFETLALDDLDRPTRYKLFMGSVIPRPIAWVTSLDAQGCVNLAPFSNFMAVSTSENLLAFSIGHDIRPDQHEKDTLRNIRALGELVINTTPCELARQVQASSKPFPPGVSEPEVLGLRTLPSRVVAPPRVAGTRVQFECVVHSILPFGESHVVMAKVVLMHVDTRVIADGKIDASLYQPLARLGGRNYCRLGDPVES